MSCPTVTHLVNRTAEIRSSAFFFPSGKRPKANPPRTGFLMVAMDRMMEKGLSCLPECNNQNQGSSVDFLY